MGELINGRTAEEIKDAIKHCNDLAPTACTGCPYNGTCIEHAPEIDALDLIERLESERDAALAKVSKWISVKERLPELDQDVLVYAVGKEDVFKDKTHITISQRYIFHLLQWDRGAEEWQAPWPYFNRNYEITHWMPLPEPPKEGA